MVQIIEIRKWIYLPPVSLFRNTDFERNVMSFQVSNSKYLYHKLRELKISLKICISEIVQVVEFMIAETSFRDPP